MRQRVRYRRGVLLAVLLTTALAAADQEPPPPPAYEERSFLDNHYPLVLDSPLHPSIEGRVVVVFALVWLFPELLAGVWAPLLAAEGPTPEGFLPEAFWGCGVHAVSTCLCPPCLIPLNILWFQPVFALNTYSRYRFLADARAPPAAPSTPPPHPATAPEPEPSPGPPPPPTRPSPEPALRY